MRGNTFGYPTAPAGRGGVGILIGTPPVLESASLEAPLEGNAGTIESSGESEEGYPPDARVVSADLRLPPSASAGVGEDNDAGKKSLSVMVTDS